LVTRGYACVNESDVSSSHLTNKAVAYHARAARPRVPAFR